MRVLNRINLKNYNYGKDKSEKDNSEKGNLKMDNSEKNTYGKYISEKETTGKKQFWKGNIRRWTK